MEAATEKTHYKNRKYVHDNFNELSNCYENLLKARNYKFTSPVGIKEHFVSFVSSNRSYYSSVMFNKQGAKGSKRLLEDLIKNTVNSNAKNVKKDLKQHITINVSFDNIQKLLSQHRISNTEQLKVLAVIITSIMATLVDGWNKSEIQFTPANCPSMWLHEYEINEETGYLNNKLDAQTLKELASHDYKNDETVVEEYFIESLEREMKHVARDLNKDTFKDTIDLKVKDSIKKRRKICSFGHINDIKRFNQKYCHLTDCKGVLQENNPTADPVINHDFCNSECTETMTNEQKRAFFYCNVPNVTPEHEAKEIPMKPLPINPNTYTRISKCFDEILDQLDMKNKNPIVLQLESDGIRKEIIDSNADDRVWVVITCDGLPYKQAVSIIQC